jgi:hypothetical protein
MPSLTTHPSRHTVIDRRDGHYLCFPDVVRTDTGTLLVAYNEFDKHVGTRRALLFKESTDNGRTWGEARPMDIPQSHCPRLARLDGGELMLLDDAGPFIHRSQDHGRTWQTTKSGVLVHGIMDRPVQLDDGVLLTTGHMHRGTFPHPAIRQANTEQMVYRSEDAGLTWAPLSVMTRQRNLVLCEASMALLPDGRLLALMRENSFVYEPMYLCVSHDQGCTWSDPQPTPLIGHRPCLDLTPGGDLLVTYRNVGPDGGTCAWLGSEGGLTDDFKPHGRHPDPENPIPTPDGLHVCNDAGPDRVVRYALRPLTDPRSAAATLEAEVRVDQAGANGCGLRLGTWFRIFPDRIEAEAENSRPVPLKPGRSHHIRLDYAAGCVTVSVDGVPQAKVSVDADHADARPVLFGAPYPFEDNEVDCLWQRVRLTVREPALLRDYTWEWTPRDGLPDQWVRSHVLELMNDRNAAFPDFGYSGWTALDNDEFLCAYHHGGGNDEDYEPMHTAHVMATRFCRDDFA